MQYAYKGFSAIGKKVNGTLNSTDTDTAKTTLLDKGITVYEIQPKQLHDDLEAKAFFKFSFLKNRISLGSWVLFLKQFTMLLSGGAVVHIALDICVKTTHNLGLKNILKDVLESVQQGHALHSAFSHHKSVPKLLPTMIRSGEEVGKLAETLDYFSKYWQRTHVLKSKIVSSLMYPAILLGVSVMVLAVLLGYIVPNIIEQVSQYSKELPFITRVVIETQTFIANYWWAMAGYVVGQTAYILYRRKNATFQYKWHKRILALPIIGYILTASYNIMFARTLSILLAGDIGLDKALNMIEPTISNTYFKSQIKTIKNSVTEGVSLSQAMADTPSIMPLLRHMTIVGEQNAILPKSLDQTSESIEAELETFLNRFIVLLEPIIILIMGGLVFLVILAVLLPILQLNTLAGII